MDARIEPLELRLREPLETSYGAVASRELLLLRLESDDGQVGWGEAAPLEPYDGVPLERCAATLAAYAGVIGSAAPGTGGAQLLDACRAADPLPQALAAVDMALWDLAGRRECLPLSAMLTDEPLSRVTVNATIGASDIALAADQARRAAQAGYRCVKLKVGTAGDAARVGAVREAAGPDVALRLDANGAWDVDGAVLALSTLSPAGLELVEEPVHGIPSIRALRERTGVRIAIDETAAEPGALASGVADAVCLKLSRAGGIGALLAQAALVRTTGAEPYIASTLDGPLGIAAAAHCAAALRLTTPCGLATLELFEREGLEPRASGGELPVPDGPGLGVDGAALLAT